MDAAERDLFREERLVLLREMAELQSELDTAEHPRRLGLRLEIQAREMLLGQFRRIHASASEVGPQMPEKPRRR
jgi:hypothetical protein